LALHERRLTSDCAIDGVRAIVLELQDDLRRGARRLARMIGPIAGFLPDR